MHAPSEREQVWIRQARMGDARAFDHLVKLYQDRIFALVKRQVSDFELAEELTQDVFVKAFRGLDRFRGESRLGTWLFRIAINQIRDYKRGKRAHADARLIPLESRTGCAPPSAATSAAPDTELSEKELADTFSRALSLLTHDQRTVLLLRHQEGLEYDELASTLGITKTNAKVRVHRARERLLALVRADGYDL